MKNKYFLLNTIILVMIYNLLFINLSAEAAPFSRGVNLTGWFQTSSAESIHFGKYTKKDFINIQSLG
ncbi:MAG: hypothetical protein R3250_03935, partial [Melioribacteraceae bacterium]|nr:hypothetical protein [Melioribacteraceae bacterium]